MNADFSFDVRFFRLSSALQPYFTALYLFDIKAADGTFVVDHLHPEWGAMRFSRGTPPIAVIGPGSLAPQWPFVVSGPTSKSIRFGLTTSCIWGLGLQPAGWAKFVEGRAGDVADRTRVGSVAPAVRVFAPILDGVHSTAKPEAVVRRIDRYLLGHLDRPSPHEDLIFACHAYVRDPETAS